MSAFDALKQRIYAHSPPRVRELLINAYSRGRSRAKFGPRFEEHLARLDATQWLGPEEMAALQAELVRGIVAYAAEHVPYWRRLFAELGVDPRDVRGPEDLRRLPVLDRGTIKADPSAFRSAEHADGRGVETFRTSGTTGQPLEVAVTADCLKLEKAFTWLHRSWGDVRLGDRIACFIGYPVVPVRRTRPPFWVMDRVENRLLFSLHHMSREKLAAYAEALERFRPEAVMGYPTAIYLMALWLRDNGRTGVRPRAVFTASETLLPAYREVIEEAFGCRVLDWYGATEIIANIVQCERGSYHVKDEYGVVEILRPDGSPAAPGEEGRLVCTGLNNHAMPLFRYAVGDAAVDGGGRCGCGRAGRTVGGIVGRVEDVVVTPDGRYISRLDFIFKTIHTVREAQLIQESRSHLRVRVVGTPGYGEGDDARIRAALRERLGDGMRFDIERVDAIPRLPSGKFRYVVSRVPLELADARQAGDLTGVAEEEGRSL